MPRCLDMYCYLPNEFILSYPQPELSLCYQEKQRKVHRNRNSLKRRRVNKIMSIESPDDEVGYYMIKESTKKNTQHHHSLQMADGDKNFLESMIHTDIIRPIPCKPSINDQLNLKSCLSSSRIDHSILSLNRTSTWRKLQANMTPSYYKHIQEFQRERQQKIRQPIMLSPLSKLDEQENFESSKLMSNITNSYTSFTSLSIDSSANLSDSNKSHRLIQLIDVDQHDDHNLVHETVLYPIEKLAMQNDVPVEEFQPISEIITPSQVPSILLDDILSSFFSTISSSNPNPHDDILKTPYMLIDNTTDMAEFLIIGQPSSSIVESDVISEKQSSKQTHSLFASIEELCLLIRNLLQRELTEQKITSLQATITRQLAVLLTYLAIPNNQTIVSELTMKDKIDKMTSTVENNFSRSTTATQTDIERIIQLNDLNTTPSTKKETSQTDLLSTSVTLHLSGHRPKYSVSDTFIYHHRRNSSSNYRLISVSETNIYSDFHHLKEETKHLLKHYVELESSNTCLEASTEFTPDFILTTINNSKYDVDDDHTEQFAFDTEKQVYQTDTISSLISEKHEKIDTLTFNSIEKENCDSLDLLGNNTTSLPLDDDTSSSKDHKLINKIDSYQLFKPRLNPCQWQVPILPMKSNSIDIIYERRMASINLKYMKIRSNSNHGIHMIGKQVRIKSNPSSRSSIPTITNQPTSALNYNNNYYEYENSTPSSGSSISIDSLYSVDSDSLDTNSTDQNITPLKKFQLLINHSKSDELSICYSLPNIHHLVRPGLSEINDKLDSNIVLAKNLLDMLDSINNHHKDSPMKDINLLHMHIKQFLIEFDTRIRRNRKRRRKIDR